MRKQEAINKALEKAFNQCKTLINYNGDYWIYR